MRVLPRGGEAAAGMDVQEANADEGLTLSQLILVRSGENSGPFTKRSSLQQSSELCRASWSNTEQ